MDKIILFIDDEWAPNRPYFDELKDQRFVCEHCRGTDAAWAFLVQNKNRVALIVLDIMMDPGERYKDEDTHSGLTTGVFLFKDLRKSYPDIPIIVLTHVLNQETLDGFSQDQKEYIRQKTDCMPFELVELIRRRLGLDEDGGRAP